MAELLIQAETASDNVREVDTSRNQVSTSNYGYHLPLKVRAVIDFQIENEKSLGIIG